MSDCRTALTNRNLGYSDITFGDGSLNGFKILNGVETIQAEPKPKGMVKK